MEREPVYWYGAGAKKNWLCRAPLLLSHAQTSVPGAVAIISPAIQLLAMLKFLRCCVSTSIGHGGRDHGWRLRGSI